MNVYIGTPVSMKEALHGTSLYITSILIKTKEPRRITGRFVLEDSKTVKEENHFWIASSKNGVLWEITGEGARLANGDRIQSPKTFPFSLQQYVNDLIRDFLVKWLRANKNLIKEPVVPIAPVKRVVPKADPVVASKVEPLVVKAEVILEPLTTGVVPEKPPMSGNLVEVFLSEVIPLEGQPRREFGIACSKNMLNSLIQEGQKQPIVVTPISSIPGKRWELVDGERRYRAALEKGEKSLTAIVRCYNNKNEQFWDSFTMNLNREGHTPIEISRAVARAIASGKTVQEICMATGFSNCTIYQAMHLQRLDMSLQDLMLTSVPRSERLRADVAKILMRLPNKADQLRIWDVASKEKTNGFRKLRVKELAAPIIASLPTRGRKRKPSDNAERIQRIINTAEFDMAFMSNVTAVDLRALEGQAGFGVELKKIARRMARIAKDWEKVSKKTLKVA